MTAQPLRAYRLAASSFYFIQGVTFSSWASRIPDVKETLGLNAAQLGGILFAIPLGQLCAMALSGYLVGKYTSAKIMRIAGLLYPGLLLPLGVAPCMASLAVALFFFGMGANLSNISVNTQCVGIEKLYGKSIMAGFHGLWSLGGLFGVLVSMVMVAWGIGPLGHFLLINLLTVALFLLAFCSLLPRDLLRGSKGPVKRRVVFEPYLLLLGVIAFGCLACEGTMYDWSGVYFASVIEAPENWVRTGYLVYMFAISCSRFTADRFVRIFGALRVILWSGFLMFGGLLTMVLFPYFWPAVIGCLIVGCGTSSVVPLCYSLAGKSKNVLPGIAIASVSTVGFFGFLLAPPIIGFVAEMTHLRVAFALMGLFGLGASALTRKLRPQ